jgi:ABC-type uncharacterized transport system permease subunit
MFTKIGRIVAGLAALSGMVAVVASFFFPFDISSPDYRSSFNFRQSTTLMSQGLAILFAGLVLGVLCEISKKLES